MTPEFIINDLVKDLGLILTSSFLAFIIVLILTKPFTKIIQHLQFGQQIKEEGLNKTKTPLFHSLHKNKTGTPTMGGILIWLTVFIVCFLSFISVELGITNNHLISRQETYLPLFTLGACAILGLVDDIFNVKKIGATKGLKAITKFAWLTIFSLLGAYWFNIRLDANHITLLGQQINLGLFYIPLFMIVVVGSANAVNITDGLDGLAAGLIILAFTCLGIVAFLKGLLILAALCGVIIGATAAFLWHNIPPAKFFMGDTGSLSLGATMAVIAFLTDTVLLLPFIGAIFVIETLSVIVQIISKKFFHKKVLHIAPIHHHFEYIGWPEFKVTMRFWMIGAFLAGFGLIIHLNQLI